MEQREKSEILEVMEHLEKLKKNVTEEEACQKSEGMNTEHLLGYRKGIERALALLNNTSVVKELKPTKHSPDKKQSVRQRKAKSR